MYETTPITKPTPMKVTPLSFPPETIINPITDITVSTSTTNYAILNLFISHTPLKLCLIYLTFGVYHKIERSFLTKVYIRLQTYLL